MARRERNRQSLARRGPKREPYDRVLIVCEGEKTEPYYFRELIAAWQLSGANVEIKGDGGSAPNSVVEYAIELFERSPDYDRVYCVFDRDGHARFAAAVQRVRDHALVKMQGKTACGNAHFEAITSIPCFEYWILLHFEYTTSHMARFANVRPRLRGYEGLAGYDKGARGLFAATQPRLETALTHADRANRAAEAANTDNPTTKMPSLIRFLRELANKKNA